MRNIYVLIGSTGQYSDRYEWLVCAYSDKDQATLAKEQAQEQADTFFKLHGYYSMSDEEQLAEDRDRKELLLIDPAATFDYTGTHYTLKGCKLI